MRLNVRWAAAVAMLGVLSGSVAAQQTVKIAYVNPQALFENAPGRVQAESTFARETAGFRTELTRLGELLQQAVQAYQREQATLTPAQRETRERSLRAREDSLRGRQQQLEEQAARRQGELMAPIMESVRKVLEDIRVEDGYAMILSSEPGQSPILVADKNLDITERVVARLRTVAASKPPAATPKPVGAPASAPSGVTRPKPPTE